MLCEISGLLLAFLKVAEHHHALEVQSHAMVWVEGTFKYDLVPAPCYGQGHIRTQTFSCTRKTFKRKKIQTFMVIIKITINGEGNQVVGVCLLFIARAGFELEWKRRKEQLSHLLAVISLLEIGNRLTTAEEKPTYPLQP